MTWYNEHPPETPLDTPTGRKVQALARTWVPRVVFILRYGKTIVIGSLLVFVLVFIGLPAMVKRGAALSDAAPFLTALQAGDLETAATLSREGSALAVALTEGHFAQITTLAPIEWDNALSWGWGNGVSYAEVRGEAEVPDVPACIVNIHMRLVEGEPSHLSFEPHCVRSGEDPGLGHSAPPDRENW